MKDLCMASVNVQISHRTHRQEEMELRFKYINVRQAANAQFKGKTTHGDGGVT